MSDIVRKSKRIVFAAEFAKTLDVQMALNASGADESILKDPDVEAMVATLLKSKFERQMVTEEMVLNELHSTAMVQKSQGDLRGAAQTLKAIGQLLGLGVGEKGGAPATAIQINIGRNERDLALPQGDVITVNVDE